MTLFLFLRCIYAYMRHLRVPKSYTMLSFCTFCSCMRFLIDAESMPRALDDFKGSWASEMLSPLLAKPCLVIIELSFTEPPYLSRMAIELCLECKFEDI